MEGDKRSLRSVWLVERQKKIQKKLDEIMEAFGEQFQQPADDMNNANGSLGDSESSLKGSVSSDFSFDSDISSDINSVGTGGFTLINSMITILFNVIPWISILVGIFLAVLVAKRTIR